MIFVRKHCYKARFPNLNRNSISFLIELFLLYAIFARLSFGQAVTSVAAPEVSNTEIRSANALSPKQDVVENRYWHLLAWQNHLDQVAAEREKQGKDGRWLRDYVQNRLGIEGDQFASVHESAQRLTEALQKIDKHVQTILDEERTAGVQLHSSPLTDSGNGSQLHQLTLDRQRAIHDEIARLQNQMGPDAFNRLNQKLVTQSVQQPQAYYRRTDETAQFAGQWNTSRSALLRGVALVQGSISGTADERDLMVESCLDDEFNPGNCDLDIGAAVATVPNSEEIDAFAFSDMSPDYMGNYNVWPGVEADLFQGSNDLDANLGDGPDGSATRNVSDSVSTGATYTDVATPYMCYYSGNGKECDPIWSNQVSAVENTAAPSISSLSPPHAAPGSSGTLTINGDNLLNIFDLAGQPQVTSSNSSVVLSSPPASSPASTSVQVNYYIAADAMPGSYDVTVENSWGTSNSAAFAVASDATIQSQEKASAQPAITMSPLVVGANCSGEAVNPTRIVWWGTAIGPYPAGDIECVTTNVWAGQQIYIGVPSFNLVNNTWANVANLTWTISDCSDSTCATKTATVHAVGGYTASAASGKVTPMPSMTQNPITFYFTAPGHYEEVDVTGTFTDGESISAWARFYVGGPTGNLLPNAQMQSAANGIVVSGASGSQKLGTANQPLTIRSGLAGIQFTTSATPPPSGAGANASFMWVQLIAQDQTRVISSVGDSFVSTAVPGLDGTYPYFAWNSYGTYDTPASQLPSMYGELWRTFDATMYLLWDPALPSGCKPATTSTDGNYIQTHSTCTSIPIPLSSVRWRYQGCAVNTLNTSSAPWVKQCGTDQVYTPVASGYPSWSSTVNPIGTLQ